jgi:hypothetical protein
MLSASQRNFGGLNRISGHPNGSGEIVCSSKRQHGNWFFELYQFRQRSGNRPVSTPDHD